MKYLLILILFFQHYVFADVKITWGEGKLKISGEASDSELQPKFNLLQTQLLIDNELSHVILSKSTHSQTLRFDKNKNSIDDLKLKIKKALLKDSDSALASNTSQKKAKKQDDKEAAEVEDYEVANYKNLIIVGSGDEYFVEEDEVVSLLVVMGGTVKIAGDVTKLVLVKGDVSVLSTGKITEKVSELSGDIDVEQGGFVTKDKTGMLDDFNFSQIVIGQLTDFSGAEFKLWFALIRWIQVVFLIWLASLVIPYFNKNLLNRKYNWLKEFFTGFLCLFAFPFISLLLLITLIGITLVPVYLFLVYLLGLLGYGLLSSIVGQRVLAKFKPKKEHSFFVCFMVGFLIFEILVLMPVIGYAVLSVILFISVGLMTNVFVKYRKESL